MLDPLYEDLPLYIRECLPKIQAKRLIVQTGDACDVDWNLAISKLLSSWGTPGPAINGAAKHGKYIVVLSRP